MSDDEGVQTRKRARMSEPPKWFKDYILSKSLPDPATEKALDDTDNDDSDVSFEGTGETYFESNCSKMKETAIKHVLNKFSPSQKKALRGKVEEGINEAFALFEKLAIDTFTSLFNMQPTSNLWKLGMGPEEIEKYGKMLEDLRTGINKKYTIGIQQILDANLDIENKEKVLQLYDVLQTLEQYSVDYISLASSINEILSQSTRSIDDKIIEVEADIKKLIRIEDTLKERILKADIDLPRKSVIYEKYLQYIKNPSDSVTSASLLEWIEEALHTPFTKMGPSVLLNETPGQCLIKLKKGFSTKLAHMDGVLEPLLTLMNNKLQNPTCTNIAIGLLGNPGVGKTCIGKIIAQVWNMPFVQISLGGILDSSILDGQHSGWVGSSPGRFTKALQEMGVINGVLFLDEIDKLGDTPQGLQVQYSLLHSIDPIQNKEYHDHYLGSKLPLDLSKCIIICALNSTKTLDPALLNRLSILNVPDYTSSQKCDILCDHLFPNALSNASLTSNDVILTDRGAKELVRLINEQNPKEGGVRCLKHAIISIVDKIGLLLRVTPEEQKELKLSFHINDIPCTPGALIKKPISITPEIINELITSTPVDISHLRFYT